MIEAIENLILEVTGATKITATEPVQELWSGYGQIVRVHLNSSKFPSIIVKVIAASNSASHPRGWDSSVSNERKLKSYRIEQAWYENYAQDCKNQCRVPQFLGATQRDGQQFLLLEDLKEAGYPELKTALTKREIEVCVAWLAHFHAQFLNAAPVGLWQIGTYWHLETRQDELNAMEPGALKDNAVEIDRRLNEARYKTLIHGDAKVANFCFSRNSDRAAAVDFQYVGQGCGIKDFAYLLGSALSSDECQRWHEELLNTYFDCLRSAVDATNVEVDFEALEAEWRALYPLAWADFSRFLMGWSPAHQKLNPFSRSMVDLGLKSLISE